MANNNYEFTILHYDTPFNTKNEAIDWLNSFENHLIGQFIQVRYQENGEMRTLLALGTKNYNDPSLSNPETVNGQTSNTSSNNNVGNSMYEIIADTGDNGNNGQMTDLKRTKIILGGKEFDVASFDNENTLIKDPLAWDNLNIDNDDNEQYSGNNPRTVFKDYKGTATGFIHMMEDLEKVSGTNLLAKRKLDEIRESIVIIHDANANGVENGSHIYAHGHMFTFNPNRGTGETFNRTVKLNGAIFPDFASTSDKNLFLNDPFEWRKLEKRTKTDENQQSSN